jgi:hypothetical protein
MNATGVPYVLEGDWVHEPDLDPPLFWRGGVSIPLDLESDRRTFAALASIGYRPTIDATPEDLADPAQRGHWIRAGVRGLEWGRRMLELVNPDRPRRPFDLYSVPAGEVRPDLVEAIVEELAPGVRALIIGPEPEDLAANPELRRCPQEIQEVRRLDARLKAGSQEGRTS